MTKPFSVVILAAALVLVGCGEDDKNVETGADAGGAGAEPFEAPVMTPLPARSKSDSSTLFAKLSATQTGLSFQNRLDLAHPMKRLYHSGFVCGGVAIGDVDGDGRPDLFFASGPGENKLFRQSGELRFEDMTAAAGVGGGEDWGAGAGMVDLDGDGDLDLYVCNYDSPNALYLNDGTGVFREAAAEFGLAQVDASLMPTFCDYDRDGDLDVFILTNRYYREGGRPAQPPFERDAEGKVIVKPEFRKYFGLAQQGPTAYGMDEVGRPDILLRNDGGRFTDVSVAAGIQKEGHGLAATWWDYDGDGFLDIYVSNDFADPDNLYRNNGDGTFTEVLAEVVNYTPWFSMGADAGDVNNDGLLDFIALDMAATTHYKSKMSMGEMGSMRWVIESALPRQVMRNCLYLNSGTGRFSEGASLAGVSSSDWSWAAKLADFDNDGRVDLFISNGMARDFNNSDIPFTPADQIGKSEWDHYENSAPKPEQNLTFRNEGDLKFSDVSADWGLDHVGMSYGSAYGDLDGDGDLDLVVVNLDEPVSIFRNESSSGNRATIRLQGQGANRAGIGALVTLEAGGVQHVRQMVPMTGFLSSNQPELHFGLGEAEQIDQLTVRWPDGGLQVYKGLEVNQHLVITEPAGGLPRFQKRSPQPLFAVDPSLRGVIHKELLYEDFARQPLLPNKLSQLGPGIAFADVDGNGSEDFFVACARGQSGAVFLNDGKGKFRVETGEPFDKDEGAEGTGVLFFDADSDGDSDLYVASGSYEFDRGDPLVRDRLYLNDGEGNFTKAPDGTLPDLRDNSSCVAAADFDRDGDLDLFVGGRVISGDYPSAAQSRLLLNESQPGGRVRFVEAPPERAPGLRDSGLVTGALWSDPDGDGWLDLLVTHEWGPVKLFKNQAGQLVDVTEAAGLAKLLGWWNSITGGDVDNDGDIDYAVGNVGLNTKYHASPEHPVLLYYGEYGTDGTKRLVEAEFENGTLVPCRGKSCSTKAIPHLAEKFKDFHAFAIAPLVDIYTPEGLSNAVKFEANTLESGMLINDGSGGFSFKPLPRPAQSSPIFGLEFCDVDADGNLDLYAVQNFSTPQFETPPFRGGLSVLLRGDGRGDFAVVPSAESGLIVPSDGRGLARTDLNGDGRPDFVVAVNHGELLAFSNRGRAAFRKLRLKGPVGNPLAAGAWVTLEYSDGRRRAAEIYQGGGYLSQSSPVLFLGHDVLAVEVRWPGGIQSRHKIAGSGAEILIEPQK